MTVGSLVVVYWDTTSQKLASFVDLPPQSHATFVSLSRSLACRSVSIVSSRSRKVANVFFNLISLGRRKLVPQLCIDTLWNVASEENDLISLDCKGICCKWSIWTYTLYEIKMKFSYKVYKLFRIKRYISRFWAYTSPMPDHIDIGIRQGLACINGIKQESNELRK